MDSQSLRQILEHWNLQFSFYILYPLTNFVQIHITVLFTWPSHCHIRLWPWPTDDFGCKHCYNGHVLITPVMLLSKHDLWKGTRIHLRFYTNFSPERLWPWYHNILLKYRKVSNFTPSLLPSQHFFPFVYVSFLLGNKITWKLTSHPC